MRKIKQKNKKEPMLIDEGNSISVKSVIIILLVIAVVLVGFYYITTIVVKNQEAETIEEADVTEEYQTEKILFGQMLTRKDKEYYVYAYDETDKIYSLIQEAVDNYASQDNALPMYRIDLNDAMNSKYVGSKTVINGDLTDLQVSGITLFKIKDGKITDYYTTASEISDVLKN